MYFSEEVLAVLERFREFNYFEKAMLAKHVFFCCWELYRSICLLDAMVLASIETMTHETRNVSSIYIYTWMLRIRAREISE